MSAASAAGGVVYLSGGVGGAKLALGLARCLPPRDLTIIANTGDDFDHVGLRICPDIDTLVYTLSGTANRDQGWGRTGETGQFMRAMRQLGGPDWFFLGDLDLAMHVERRRRMDAGQSLSAITADLARAMGIHQRILPMSDDPAPTVIQTADGPIPFQDYFVRLRAEPVVTGFSLAGGGKAHPGPDVLAALDDAAAVIIGPSNPFISIDPILTLPGIRDRLRRMRAAGVPVLAVSPIVGGTAIKGPTAKMMAELGEDPSVEAVARRYADIVSTLVLDSVDQHRAATVRAEGVEPLVLPTVMKSAADKVTLAAAILHHLRNGQTNSSV